MPDMNCSDGQESSLIIVDGPENSRILNALLSLKNLKKISLETISFIKNGFNTLIHW